ncbi:MAG: hypothetical protein EBT80_02705 [Chitinophagales bacterium]|nr:hypothetical protein [Chitinophagales bacterium]
MKKLLRALTLVLILFFYYQGWAQPKHNWLNKIEIGFNSGPQFFLGDLGGSTGAGTAFIKDIDWEETRPSAGFYLNIHPLDWFSIRAAAQMGVISGNDRHSPAISQNDIFRFNRNLHFHSTTQELYLALALYPLQLIPAKAGSWMARGLPFNRFDSKGKDLHSTRKANHIH